MLWAYIEQIVLLGIYGVFDQKIEEGDQRFNRQKWQAHASTLLCDCNIL